MYARANGIRIHYRVDGRAGAPWVTFVTGIANDVTMWDGQVPSLELDFRILRYDSRGHGGTEATEGDYGFDTLIGDLLGLWDALGIRQSHLVGLGLGGSSPITVLPPRPSPTRCDWRISRASQRPNRSPISVSKP